MDVNVKLTECLNDLEARIDPDVEGALRGEWVTFAESACEERLFIPCRPAKSEPGVEWPTVSPNAGMDDYDAMALQQFGGCSDTLRGGGGGLLCVRCNYSTAILPSVFGAELFVMDDELRTLPTSRPVPGGLDAIKAVIDRGIPDIGTGLGGRCFDMAERFLDVMANYPKIGKYVTLYHPDLQGPMDVCELLAGSALFTYVYDAPDVIHDLLRLVTVTYIEFMREWLRLVPQPGDYGVHWAMMHKGPVMLRDDSAMNFSPGMFEEFIRPYDQSVLDEFGGGAIHFCGRGDHFIEPMSRMSGLTAIAMSQPHLNDMERVFANTVDKGIKLIGFPADVCPLAETRDLHGQVQVFR